MPGAGAASIRREPFDDQVRDLLLARAVRGAVDAGADPDPGRAGRARAHQRSGHARRQLELPAPATIDELAADEEPTERLATLASETGRAPAR